MRISDWSSDVCSSDLSKSWDEFSGPDAPKLDFIFTVCDNAAGETCPIWPGRPMSAHWGIEDPAAVEGSGQREAFERALHYLSNRISLFLALPHDNIRSEEHTSELQSLMRNSYAVFCLKKKKAMHTTGNMNRQHR